MKGFIFGALAMALLAFVFVTVLGIRYHPEVPGEKAGNCISQQDVTNLGARVLSATCGRLPVVAIEQCSAQLTPGSSVVCKDVEGLRCVCGYLPPDGGAQ